jgi:hypothetical protein
LACSGKPLLLRSRPTRSRARVAEAIAHIKLAWTQERVHFQGKYWQADNLPVLPQPVQQPHPPLLLAANSNDTSPYGDEARVIHCVRLHGLQHRVVDVEEHALGAVFAVRLLLLAFDDGKISSMGSTLSCLIP